MALQTAELYHEFNNQECTLKRSKEGQVETSPPDGPFVVLGSILNHASLINELAKICRLEAARDTLAARSA